MTPTLRAASIQFAPRDVAVGLGCLVQDAEQVSSVSRRDHLPFREQPALPNARVI